MEACWLPACRLEDPTQQGEGRPGKPLLLTSLLPTGHAQVLEKCSKSIAASQSISNSGVAQAKRNQIGLLSNQAGAEIFLSVRMKPGAYPHELQLGSDICRLSLSGGI